MVAVSAHFVTASSTNNDRVGKASNGTEKAASSSSRIQSHYQTQCHSHFSQPNRQLQSVLKQKNTEAEKM
eukprot:c20621_g1_i1 orf=806-1015(+)